MTPEELVPIRERDQGFISSHSRLVVDDHRQTATDRSALLGEVDRLRKWLTDAITDISDWGAYAGDYFQEKWDLQGTLRQYRDALDGKEHE